MIRFPRLHAIGTGVATFEEAAATLEHALGEGSGVPLRAVLAALRDWTWKAVHSGRLDEDVAAWRDLVEGVRARVPDQEVEARAGLRVLSELLSISIHFGATVSDESVARRAHVLAFLEAADREGGARRQDLMEAQGTSEAHAAATLTDMLHTGHVERDPRQGEGVHRLTRKGESLLAALRGS